MSRPTPRRGEVWSVALDPTSGHEQGGTRPALIVLPITGTNRGIAAHLPIAPGEAGLTRSSFVMADQIRTMSRGRLGRRWGTIQPATMIEVEDRLRFLLDL